MVMQILNLGAGPLREKHAEVGSNDYQYEVCRELAAFRNQLLRKFGQPPPGAALSERFTPHPAGACYELVIYYEDRSQHATEWARMVYNNIPHFWDDDARKELAVARDTKKIDDLIGDRYRRLLSRMNEIASNKNPTPEEIDELSALVVEMERCENIERPVSVQTWHLKRIDAPPPRIVADDE